MQTRFSFDRTRLIPTALRVVLILGLGWILSACSPGSASTPVKATATPSSSGTLETATPTLFPTDRPVRDDTLPTATPPEAYPGPAEETLSLTSTLVTETLPPPSPTLTPAFLEPLAGGKYDDVDPHIVYDPYWTALKNKSTRIAYLGTIHASNSIGQGASFRFKGKRFSLGYMRGKSFGTVTVIVDDQTYSFHEQAFDLVWNSPTLPPGDHFVRIIHESGESVNLDYVLIVE
jgi:hypothetical protein